MNDELESETDFVNRVENYRKKSLRISFKQSKKQSAKLLKE